MRIFILSISTILLSMTANTGVAVQVAKVECSRILNYQDVEFLISKSSDSEISVEIDTKSVLHVSETYVVHGFKYEEKPDGNQVVTFIRPEFEARERVLACGLNESNVAGAYLSADKNEAFNVYFQFPSCGSEAGLSNAVIYHDKGSSIAHVYATQNGEFSICDWTAL
jgi:hypothetical protein